MYCYIKTAVLDKNLTQGRKYMYHSETSTRSGKTAVLCLYQPPLNLPA